jgi:hypothetical protein
LWNGYYANAVSFFGSGKMSFGYPRDVRYLCIKCGICCGDTKEKVRKILLLYTEAKRIAKVTSKPIDEFAEEIAGHEPYVYAMKKTVAEGKCVFLEKERCAVYASRPLVCRFYPFELRVASDGKHEFLYTNECPGIGKGKRLTGNYFRRLFRQLKVQNV